jgi:hypothetical protein
MDKLPHSTGEKRLTNLLRILAILGIVARVALAVISWGTNDADTFAKFGYHVSTGGLIEAYRSDSDLNHPPIPALWCAMAWRLTDPATTGERQLYSDGQGGGSPGRWFSLVFKFPVLTAECVSVWLLYLIWRKKRGSKVGLAVAAAYSWSACAILISGYHCNTDPIYAMFCLLAVYFLADKSWYFWGGVALGAAINVKLSPVLLVPPILIAIWPRKRMDSARHFGEFGRFCAGLSLGILPFIPILLNALPQFYSNAMAYKSFEDKWGVVYLLMNLSHVQTHAATVSSAGAGEGAIYPLADAYHNHGRWFVIGVMVAWGFFWRLSGRRNLYDLAAIVMALFLVLAPGFGVQYTIAGLPLLFAARPLLASVYSLIAGVFLVVTYIGFYSPIAMQMHLLPLMCQFTGLLPGWAPQWGLGAWGVLVIAIGAAMVKEPG